MFVRLRGFSIWYFDIDLRFGGSIVRDDSGVFTKLCSEHLVRRGEQCSWLLQKVDRGEEEAEPWSDHGREIDVLEDFEVIGTEDLISLNNDLTPVHTAFHVKTGFSPTLS
jgi:hypothetical protein